MNRKHNDRAAGNEQGQTLVEAALALMLTLTILVGIMEFGRAAWSYNTVAHAAREGARFAMVHGKASKAPATQADIQAVVQRQAIGLLPANTQIVVTWIPNNTPGSAVKVAVTYSFSSIVPFVSSSVMNLKGTSQMVILN